MIIIFLEIMTANFYDKLSDLEDLEVKWYVIFDTDKGSRFSYPVKSLPENFYEYMTPDGLIKIDHIHRLFDMSYYDLEGEELLEARIIENIIPRLFKHFHKDKPLTKTLNEHREYLKNEIKKFESQYQIWLDWVAECYKDKRLVCRDCNIPLYNSKQHFETSQVRFIICEKCSHIPCEGNLCKTDGCSNFVNRNMVTGEPYVNCFNCYNIFERKKCSLKSK
jgi:hypothetical protein